MNKRNPTKTSKKKQQPPQKPNRKSPPRKLRSFSLIRPFSTAFRKTVLGVAFILGIVGGIYVLVPRIEVSSHQTINPRVTFSAPFVVSNRGNFPVYNVELTCELIDVKELRKGGWIIKNVGIATDKPVAKKLGSDKQATTFCPVSRIFSTKSQLFDAIIGVKLTYKYLWIIPGSKTYRFKTIINQQGQVYWLPIAS